MDMCLFLEFIHQTKPWDVGFPHSERHTNFWWKILHNYYRLHLHHFHLLHEWIVIEYNNYKLIYRRYAGLFFTIAVDVMDNELSYLETIHLFVELLDSYFSNVCELDIVFNFNKVYSILDEFMLAGEIEETSKREILDRVKLMEKME